MNERARPRLLSRSIPALLTLCCTAAQADLNLQVKLDSNYVYRGLNQTEDGAGAHTGVDLQLDNGWFGGLSASRVDYGRPTDGRDLQKTYFAGKHARLSEDIAYGAAFVYYDYNDDRPIDYDWAEMQMTAQVRDHWTAMYAYSNDWYGLGDASHTAELTYRYALPADFTAAITCGFAKISGRLVDSYGYADVGLAWTRGPFTSRVAFTATNDGVDAFGSAADNRWSLSLSWLHSLR